MKTLIISLITLTSLSLAHAGSSLKLEGSCSGKLADGTEVSYSYYSNFNGCKKTSVAAVIFTNGIEGLYTGTRSFTKSSDIYTFNAYKLIFANSTGNTTGKLIYKKKTAKLSCEVRDYEYSDC